MAPIKRHHKAIEKAILTSELGLNPNNDGKVIHLLEPRIDGIDQAPPFFMTLAGDSDRARQVFEQVGEGERSRG